MLRYLAAGFLLLASPVLAAPVTYQCSVKPSDDGWIQGPVTATFDTAAQRVAVIDPIVQDANGGRPVEARYRQRNNGKLEATWSLPNVRRGRGGGQKVVYTLEIDPRDTSAILRIRWDRVGENDQSRPPRGAGSCNVTGSPNLLG